MSVEQQIVALQMTAKCALDLIMAVDFTIKNADFGGEYDKISNLASVASALKKGLEANIKVEEKPEVKQAQTEVSPENGENF